MKLLFFLNLLFTLLTFCFCEEIEEEVFYEVSLIHENSKKNVLLNKWRALVEEALHVVKEKKNIVDEDIKESHLVFWHNNGEKLNEAVFETDKFKEGSKHVYVFVSSEYLQTRCVPKDNIYKKLGNEIERYKNLFINMFSSGDKKSEEWVALEEVLNLLLKSKDIRNIFNNLKSDADIELVRQKVIELTETNESYKSFVIMLKENENIIKILTSAEEWNKFVKANLDNLKKLIESYIDDSTSDL